MSTRLSADEARSLVCCVHLLYTARPMRTPWFSALWIGGSKISFGRMLLVTAMVFMVNPLHAEKDQFGYGTETLHFDESLVEKWKESKFTVPSYPNDRDLLPVSMPTSSTLKIYIDSKSISRAPDLVARFTFIVESPSGARNVFYDGLRCETREYKTYAIGTTNHTLVPVKNPTWQRIPQPEFNAFRDYLYRHYVCDKNAFARSPEDLVRLIKYGSTDSDS